MNRLVMALGFIAMALVSGYISTVVHELGHTVVGLANGWRFVLFTVGPFKLYREDLNGKIKFGLEKNVINWGGISATLPTDMRGSNTDVFARVLLGGPLASIIFGLISIAVFAFTKVDFLLLMGMISIGMGTACAIPMKVRTGNILNDGTRYRKLKGEGKVAEEEKANLILAFASVLDSDALHDDSLIEELLTSEDKYTRFAGLHYAYDNAKKLGNEASMADLKAQIESLSNEIPASAVKQYGDL